MPKVNAVSLVEQVVKNMKDSEDRRSHNRALIADLFNGEPPYTQEEQQAFNIETNVNWLEASKIAQVARGQFNRAFVATNKFCKVAVDIRDPKKGEWSHKITKSINRITSNSHAYLETRRAQFASVVLHGPGPVVWPNRTAWAPEFFGVRDVLIPDNTYLSLSNLPHYAIRRKWTPAELVRMAGGDTVVEGWNKAMVSKIKRKLVDMLSKGMQTDASITSSNPEEVEQTIKQGSVYLNSSAAPCVTVWDFYHIDHDDPELGWCRKILIAREENTAIGADEFGADKEFLFESKGVWAKHWSNIAHWQFGDGSNVPPFIYHTIRSLGYLLYGVGHVMNRLRCRWADATFQELMQLFKLVASTDVDKLQQINLINNGLIPEGLAMIPRQERHQPNERMIAAFLSENRRMVQESSSQFTQDIAGSNNEPLTATETIARTNVASALTSAMMALAYTYDKFQQVEICRRFCKAPGNNPDIARFRKEMKDEGVPEEALNPERWDVTVERTLGAGDRTIEMLQADRLMQVRPALDPDPQRKVVNFYVRAYTDDPNLADEIASVEKKVLPSDTVIEAQQAAGACLMGIQMGLMEGVNRPEFTGVIATILEQKVEEVNNAGGIPRDMQDLNGLKMLAQYAMQNLQLLTQDEAFGQLVAQLGQSIGQSTNEIRAFEQRLAEKMQSEENSMDPKDQAEIRLKQMEIQMEAMRMQMQMQLAEKQANLAMALDAQKASTESAIKDMQSAAKIANDARTTNAKIANAEKVSSAKAEAAAKKPKPTTTKK